MELIRKWNPESALHVNNANGPKVFRIIALLRDGVNDHYVCFYDSWTGKVYIEEARMRHGSSYFDHSSLYQVADDKQFKDLMDYLSSDVCQVIQMVDNRYEKDKETGKFTMHENLSKLPLTKYGVDSNGNQSITGASPLDMQISPSLVNEDGTLIT